MDLKLNDCKNDRGKEIKDLKVTTTSTEEVLPDKKNTRKVVSKINRSIKFIETSIPGSLPAPSEDASTPDPGGPKPQLEQPSKNELFNNRGTSPMDPMDPI
jgi:hypothetical protein